jgi:hypothetical protein
MEFRLTTRIALALLLATILGLTFYAYPSWAGFVSLVFRAAAIVGALVVVVLLIAAFSKRRPGRLDLLLVLSSIGLVIAAWPQLRAVSDFHRLESEIEVAGRQNVVVALARTDTMAGTLVRNANILRNNDSQQIEVLFDGLWSEQLENAIAGANAADPAALTAAVDEAARLRQATEDAQLAADDILDAEIEAILAIDTPLPDSARLSFTDAAIQRLEADREFYRQRFALADQRLVAAEGLITLLTANADGYTFNATTRRVQFTDREIGIDYERALAAMRAFPDQEEQLIAEHVAGEVDAMMKLVDAAGTTP